jgi:hypothetical protein
VKSKMKLGICAANMRKLAVYGTGSRTCCVMQSSPVWGKRLLDMLGHAALLGVAIPIEKLEL